MRIIIPILFALIALAMIHFSGLLADWQFSHPFWHLKATLVGGAIGAGLSLIILWLTNSRRRLERVLAGLALLALAASAWLTWQSGQTFINSQVFEARAGMIWNVGYHAVTALIVLLLALGARGILFRTDQVGSQQSGSE